MELAALRESMRKLAPEAVPATPRGRPEGLPTGFGALDRHLRDRGLPRGRVSEIAGPPSSGKTALALAALAAQTRAGALTAYVDARGDFYPPAAAALGAQLPRLLVSRAPDAAGAVRAAEILARSRAFPLIAIALPAGGLAPPLARRLGAAAAQGRVALLLVADRSGAAEGAAVRVEVAPARSPRGGRQVCAIVKKGSTSGGAARAAISLAAIRVDDAPPAELPPITRRAVPGTEHEHGLARAGGAHG